MTDSANLVMTTPTDREIILTRVFDAPRSLVFQALTSPPLLTRWMLGPPGWQFSSCLIDLRPSGSYRYVWRHEDGNEMGVGGVYRQVVQDQLIVATQRFDHDPAEAETLVTTELTPRAEQTLLVIGLLYSSREARDAALKFPMKEGMAASYDRLATLLQSAPTGDFT